MRLSKHFKKMNGLIQEREGWSPQQLLDDLAACAQITVDMIERMAADVHCLEQLGADLSGWRDGMCEWIRLIACQNLLPEAFCRYRGAGYLLDRISRLPTSDQARLVGPTPAVEVVCVENSETTVRRVDPLDLSKAEINQVFGSREIRSLAQQRSWLEGDRKSKLIKVSGGNESEDVLVDRRRHSIHVKKDTMLTRKQLAEFLQMLE